MKSVLVVVLVTLAVVSAKPRMNKECFENRPKVRPSECCTGSALMSTNALNTCQNKYPVPTPPTGKDTTEGRSRRHHGASCVIECYFNETSILKNGVFDKATALEVLGKDMDANMKAALVKSVDTCVAVKESFKNKPRGDKKPGKGGKDDDSKRPPMPHCGRDASFFAHCIEADLFKNCPAVSKVSSDDCTALTTYMDKCFPKKD